MRMHLGLFPGRALSEPQPPAWTPADTTTLLWLDNVDTSVVTLGTGISQWNDKSGNNLHGSQSIGANQPTIVPARLNGLSGVRFSQAAPTLLLGSGVVNTSGRFTVVMLWENIANWPGLWFYNGNGNGTAFGAGTGVADPGNFGTEMLHLSEAQYWRSSGIFHTPDTAQVMTYRSNVGVSSALVSVNNAILTAFPGGVDTQLTPTGAWQIGARNPNGYLYEIIVLPEGVADDIVWRTQGYLAWKYGKQADLNVGHPYRSVRPVS